MSASVRRLSIVLLAVATTLAACGDDTDDSTADGPTTTVGQTVEGNDTETPTTLDATTTTVPDQTDCGGADWVTVDVGPFSFRTPPDLIDQEVQGIDSLVGQYERDGMSVGFDFGWYSGNETTQYPDDATTMTIDGLEGDFVQVETGDDPLAPSRFLVSLYVPIPGDADDLSQTALAFWVRYAAAADGETAACMPQTIDFS